MNETPKPPLADPSPPDQPSRMPAGSGLDLDERILRVERRLIAREEGVQRSLHSLSLRVRHAARRPKELALPVMGGVAAIGGLIWGLRARHSLPSSSKASSPARNAGGSAAGGRGSTSAGGSRFPWVRMVSLGWPLLPQHLRARVNPTAVTTAMTVGVPLLEAVLGSGRPPKAPVHTALQVDLSRYAGTWHEIARLPAPFEAVCKGQPTATYRLRATPDGPEVEVINRCRMLDGKTRATHGVAVPVKGSGGAKLKVTMFPKALRWLPFAWANYWVLFVDDDYSLALVGNPSRSLLWVLARRPEVAPSDLQALVDMAAEQGFPVDRLKIVEPR